MKPTFSRNAFTLIELLVVIAIIALLAALVVPGISSAKRKADSIMCRSNLRSMATAVTTYAVDHDDWLPPGPNAPGVTAGLRRSHRATYTANTGIDPNPTQQIAYHTARYLGMPAPDNEARYCPVMRCPSAWKRADKVLQTQITFVNYCLCQRKVGDPTTGTPPFGTGGSAGLHRMVEATAEVGPTKMWMLTDSDQKNDPSHNPQTDLLATPAHDTTRNVVFFDTHVADIPVTAVIVDDPLYAQ